MRATDDETRRRSSALFGNEKVVEVVLALRAGLPATAQSVASSTGIAHNLASAVLKKLAAAGVLTALPRTGSRSPAYYDATSGDAWTSLVALCHSLKSGEDPPLIPLHPVRVTTTPPDQTR